jgi:RHS repeat-associated protein
VQFPDYSTQNVHVDYDVAGRPIGVTDATGSTTLNYDTVRKRLTSVVTVLGGRTYTVSYTYFGDGKVATMTSPAGTTSYQYNANGRLISLTSPVGETTTYGYDHAGRLTSETTTTTAGVPVSTTYAWGVSGQMGDPSTAPAHLRTIAQTVNGAAFETYTLNHSYLGQLQQQTGAGAGVETLSYGYDNRGRLTSDSEAVTTGGQAYSASGTYQYDLSNNLQGGTNGWAYNSNNQVTGAPGMGGLSGATGLGYDNGGHLTSANGMTLAWDPFGRLSSVTGTPSGTVSFTYDGLGRRVSKTVGTATTYYLYDGGLLIAEIDGATGLVSKSYQWGATGLVSDRSGGASRYYLYDRSGSTRYLLGASGSVLSSGAYQAWGSPLAGLAPNTPLGWNGRFGLYTDAETGLILCGARYYAPSIGRFISRDPAGLSAGPNVYAYCGDDPVDVFDATGLEGEPEEGVFQSGVKRGAATALGMISDFAFAPIRLVKATADGLYNTAAWAGDTMGRYDSGKATAGQAAYACGVFSVSIVGTAFSIEGLAAPALAGATGAGGLEAAGAVRISPRGLDLVESHLGTAFESAPYNEAMIARLRSALNEGRTLTGADADFYLHEAAEATMMRRGMGYDAAHAAALEKYGVSEFNLYHPDVIQSMPEWFGQPWFDFWGIGR